MIDIRLRKKLHDASGEMMLDIDMHIEPGELITLYGPSGAGKTTLLRILAGLVSAEEAIIMVNGKVWADTAKKIFLSPQNRKTGFVFQDYALFPNMTVMENLLFATPSGKDKKIVDEIMQFVELDQLAKQNIQKLSGGQKQRVALARAIARQPDLLLLDEPLAALDDEMRFKLQEYILQIHRRYKITTLIVSHDISEIYRMSDRVFQIEKGKIIKHGKPDEVFQSRQISGKFQFTGKVLSIVKEDIIFVVQVLIGNNIVKIIATAADAAELTTNDQVMVSSKGFNPLIRKI